MRPPGGQDAVERVVALVRGARAPAPMKTKVLAIDGGGGKSTLAARVAERLGGVAVIATDDFASWRNALDWHEVKAGTYLIVEGVSSSRVAFAPYLAASVWVATARLERLRRGLQRDGQDALSLWQDWMAAEDEYIARERPDLRADLVISGADS